MCSSTLTDRHQQYPLARAVANTVRGVLDVKEPKQHLQCSNESMKTIFSLITNKNERRQIKKTNTKKIEPRAIRSMPFRIGNTSPLYPKKGITYTIPYSQGSQVSLSAQLPPLRESFGRSNQCGPEASQAPYGHPRCNLNLVHIYRPSLPLPSFGPLFLSPQPRCHKPPTPFAYCIVSSPSTHNKQMQWSISHVFSVDG